MFSEKLLNQKALFVIFVLRFGQEIAFTTESIPGRTFDGRISFISPELDPSTRTVAVRVNVPNQEELLKPGMFVSGIVLTVLGLIGGWIKLRGL